MSGKNKSILAKAVSSYNDYMFMPIEFRNKIADKNLSCSFYALIITSSLCLLDLIILTVMNVKNLENVRYHLIFPLLMSGFFHILMGCFGDVGNISSL